MSQIEDAIANFGTPCYQYTDGKKKYYFWFTCNLYLLEILNPGDYGYSFAYRRLEVREVKKSFFGKKAKMLFVDNGSNPLGANVQAKWEMSQVDKILLGDNDGSET